MILIDKIYRIKELTAEHVYKLTQELDKREITFECRINRKNPKLFDITTNERNLTEVITLYAKIKSASF